MYVNRLNSINDSIITVITVNGRKACARALSRRRRRRRRNDNNNMRAVRMRLRYAQRVRARRLENRQNVRVEIRVGRVVDRQ